jgi:hypothetical protein
MYGLHDPCILKSNKYDPTKCVIIYIAYNITIHILIVEKILHLLILINCFNVFRQWSIDHRKQRLIGQMKTSQPSMSYLKLSHIS